MYCTAEAARAVGDDEDESSGDSAVEAEAAEGSLALHPGGRIVHEDVSMALERAAHALLQWQPSTLPLIEQHLDMLPELPRS